MRSLALPAIGILLGSSCANSSEQPPVFGGEGARVEAPAERPLEDGQGELATGPCNAEAPPSDNTLLEDFEDGDHHLFKVFERDGWWFTATDDTAGSVQPPRDGFKPSLLPEAEAAPDNRYAAHLVASGFTDWGVVWGTTLEWRRQGIKCPFNASAFSGVAFRVRGSGRIRLNFGNPATFPVDNGGSCQKGCYDTHGRIIDLTPEWVEHSVTFDKLQQGGWGSEARFDPERLLSMNFNANPEWLPVDVWLDDLRWIGADAPAAASAPPPAVEPAASAAPVGTATAPTSAPVPPAATR
jgi:hypothetical protein